MPVLVAGIDRPAGLNSADRGTACRGGVMTAASWPVRTFHW
jgi:hypothetical protein